MQKTKAAKAKATKAPKAESFSARFKREVITPSKKAGHFVLVKYSATWCAPCKTFAPVIKRVLTDWPKVTLVTYDIDLSEMLPHLEKVNISAVPTLHLYSKGRKVADVAGTMSRAELIALLEKHCG